MSRVSINKEEIEWNPLSLGADNFGRVFCNGGKIYRALTVEGAKRYHDFVSSDLLMNLINLKYIPNTVVSELHIPGFELVLEHERVDPFIMPYEWTFTMFQDAALFMLEFNVFLRQYGYQTMDGHPYNIVFKGCTPVFIDLGSIVPILQKTKWQGLDEFKCSMINYIDIWANSGSFFIQSFLNNVMNTMSEVDYLKFRSIYSVGSMSKKTSTIVSFLKKKSVRLLKRENKVEMKGTLNLEEIKEYVKSFTRNEKTTLWNNYHQEYITDLEILKTPRFSRIIEIVDHLEDAETLIDLGANMGVVSRLILTNTHITHCVCADYDEDAVDKLYMSIKGSVLGSKISPMHLNFVYSNNPLGRESTMPYANGRCKSDIVMALAVTHHLLLSQNVNIDYLFEVIAKYANKYVLIEFMPLGLWYSGCVKVDVPAWYTLEWFRESFCSKFVFLSEDVLEENRILFTGKLN